MERAGTRTIFRIECHIIFLWETELKSPEHAQSFVWLFGSPFSCFEQETAKLEEGRGASFSGSTQGRYTFESICKVLLKASALPDQIPFRLLSLIPKTTVKV